MVFFRKVEDMYVKTGINVRYYYAFSYRGKKEKETYGGNIFSYVETEST